VQRRLAAIVVADVVGYARLMERDEAGTLARLKALRREVIDPALARHHGRIAELQGDAAIAEFGSVVAAVSACVEIQTAMAAHEAAVPEDRRVRYRVGINLGDVVVDGDAIHGDGINVAARLQSLCEPGAVMISGWAYDHLQGKLDLALEHRGEQRLKNIDRPVRVYQWRSGAAKPPQPAKREPPPWRKATEALVRALHGGMAWLRPVGTGPGARPPVPDEPSIAVLPFANNSGDPNQDYLGEGITEDIITQLARYKNLFVIARNSTLIYTDKPVDIRQVGRDLGVRYVLEGSVRRGGDTLRVTGQLIEAANGRHVWAQSYDRAAADLFAVQDEITQSIVGELLPHLRKAEAEAAFRRPTQDLRAYHLLRQGIEHHYVFTREHNLKARELFSRAAALSPGYADAYAYWAFAHYIDHVYALSGPPRDESLAEGLVLLGKAQRADPSCPVIYQALSQIYMAQGRFDEMLAAAEKALRLGPSDAENWIIYADALGTLGRYEEGIAAAERALRLNPLAPPYYPGILAYQLYAAERYADAVRILAPSTECNPSQPSCTIFLALSLLHLGRVAEAKAALERTRQDFPNLNLRDYLAPGAYVDQTQPPKIWADLRKLGVTETPPGF
jgi:adenylate cyclase